MKEKSLNKFIPGESGIVSEIAVTGLFRRRLLDMGITPGVEITLRKTAPLGDPIEITVRGYELSIRKSEAQAIIMRKAGN